MSLSFSAAGAFDNPRADIAAGSATTLQNVSAATLAGWVDYTGFPTAQEEVIVMVSNALSLASARANISLRHQTNVYRASARRLDADAVSIVDSTTVIQTVPTFVCGVFEYTNQIARIYINGVQENTLFIAGWTGNTSNTAALGAGIGGRADGNITSSITGIVSNVMCYSRALSAVEIMNLYMQRGRDSNYFGLGNRLRLQGVAPGGTLVTTPDSVGSATASAAGAPTPVYAEYLTVGRSRRGRR
jgi:Concanavalin A-like lectin/glucanases superfamily